MHRLHGQSVCPPLSGTFPCLPPEWGMSGFGIAIWSLLIFVLQVRFSLLAGSFICVHSTSQSLRRADHPTEKAASVYLAVKTQRHQPQVCSVKTFDTRQFVITEEHMVNVKLIHYYVHDSST